ncbi:hypothetical protein Emin_0259 [Elusimicrobium minutum Pei191]|uniref:Cobalamin adenosyltransferase-like domain-containing protein n=1 Tax=Elusimicrobium minutum (strain Pei191) TaxID=445932 RepID=B2KB62_ELUMP|nr:ATP:cob(I)alamin adenosyltransferase [Elusimicrobium minutum]ACC97821.1 hypothetical protein Emin_0259 [Elusimicrobium minutum Pei191]
MKKGDLGLTDLIGEKSVKKSDLRVRVLAYLEDFMAALGMVKLKTQDNNIDLIQNSLLSVMQIVSGAKAELNLTTLAGIEDVIKNSDFGGKNTAAQLPGCNETETALRNALAKCHLAESYLTELNITDSSVLAFINHSGKYLAAVTSKYI